MATRIEQHALERHAVGRLKIGPLGDGGAGGSHARRQVVSHPLQLAQVEQPGRGAAARGLGIETAEWIGGDEGRGELALKLGDLHAQRSACRPLALLRRGESLEGLARCVALQDLHGRKPYPHLGRVPRPNYVASHP
ncbi:MAG: hypothetical protein ACLP4R_31090 [Solirubrobacteraceae bacterium]